MEGTALRVYLRGLAVVGCPFGLYGANCKHECSGNCAKDVHCNRDDGKCPDGRCSSGWMGPRCEEGESGITFQGHPPEGHPLSPLQPQLVISLPAAASAFVCPPPPYKNRGCNRIQKIHNIYITKQKYYFFFKLKKKL